jgi:hypothetical protein
VVAPQTAQYRQFLQDLQDRSRDSSLGIRLSYRDVEEFAEDIRSSINKEVDIPGGVEQLAVVCSNLPSRQDIYSRFYDTVLAAIQDTDRVSLQSFDSPTGHIKLKELEPHINRADTIIVICFDEEWLWATSIMREIRQLLRSDAAKRARLLVVGPQARTSVRIDPSALRFRALDAHSLDEKHLRELLKEAIMSGDKGTASGTPPEKMN